MDTKQYLSLLPVIVEDIHFVKLQQWRVIYYTLLSHGAIAGFYRLITVSENSIDLYMKCLLSTSALLIAGLGIWILYDLQSSLVKYRIRLHNMYLGISKTEVDFYDAWGRHEKNKESFFYQYFSFSGPFSITMTATAFFVKCLVFGSYEHYILYISGYIAYIIFISLRFRSRKKNWPLTSV